MLSKKDIGDARGGYFWAVGLWLFGITLVIGFMAYNAAKR